MRRLKIENHNEIEEGEFRELRVGEGKLDNILISRYGGKIYATGAYCTHLGAPFAPNGLLIDDKVFCPYHAAAYSVVTGISENGPGRDGIETFEVVKQGNDLYVNVPESLKKAVQPAVTKRDPNDKRNFVIIGAGAAGLTCAETLRYSGYTGKITLINGEKISPYDRTMLTKTLPFGKAENFVFRDDKFYEDTGIDLVSD
jgi:nitrite reductase/ring-hydroxylating ferredoxin subunit